VASAVSSALGFINLTKGCLASVITNRKESLKKRFDSQWNRFEFGERREWGGKLIIENSTESFFQRKYNDNKTKERDQGDEYDEEQTEVQFLTQAAQVTDWVGFGREGKKNGKW